MAYKAWFIETTEWYVEIPDAATPAEASELILAGDERVWDVKDFCSQELEVTFVEEM